MGGTRRLRSRFRGRRRTGSLGVRYVRYIRNGMRGPRIWGLRGLGGLGLPLSARGWDALRRGVGLFRRLRGRRSCGSRRGGGGSRSGRRGSGGTASRDELGLDGGPRLLLEHRTHGGMDGAKRAVWEMSRMGGSGGRGAVEVSRRSVSDHSLASYGSVTGSPAETIHIG